MNVKRLLGYYEQVADAPDAVARLRRFILDLAVRGKLVLQDAADEPASELLKRIAKEKSRLVKAGDIKIRKIQSRDLQNPAAFECPPGWAFTNLGEVALKITDGAHKTPTYVEYGVPFVSVKDFSAGKLDLSSTRFIPEHEHKLLYQRCDPRRGDIILGRIGTLGKAVLIDTDIEFSLFVSVGLIRFDHCFTSANFLRFLLNSPFVEAEFNRIKIGGGTHTNKLNLADLHTIALPFPPLAEQHRIVAKVDELMGLCDRLEAARANREAMRDQLAAASLARLAAPVTVTLRQSASASNPPPNVAARSTTPAATSLPTREAEDAFADHARFVLDALPALTARPDQIKALRQAVLSLAVRGRLVPQHAADESAIKLFERLKRAQIDACKNEGIRARPPIDKIDRQGIWFDFPLSWVLTSFDDIFVIVSGATKGQKTSVNEAIDLPYLRVANVQRGYLDLSVIKNITVKASDQERYALRQGDILMTEGGDWDKLGRAAVWNDEIHNCIHQNHVFRVRPPSKDILSAWIVIYVNSLLGRSYFENASKQTTNLASINMTQLRGCPLPLPPLAEQHRIVAKVDALMALCDKLEASLAAAADTRRRLLDALLAEALVPDEDRLLEAAE